MKGLTEETACLELESPTGFGAIHGLELLVDGGATGLGCMDGLGFPAGVGFMGAGLGSID